MAFSPETFYILTDLINAKAESTNQEISTINESLAKKFEKGANTLTTTMFNYIEASFTAASNNSIVTGVQNSSTWALSWWGVKSTSSKSCSVIFSVSGAGGSQIGIATRDTEEKWSATPFR